MRAALVVNKVTLDVAANLADIETFVHEAAEEQTDLVLFPEAALTGLINNDEPAHDLPLGQSVPGPFTGRLGDLARQCSIHIAAGLLERQGDCLYDSAVLLGPEGGMLLHYRRIQPQWHGPRADPKVYRQGQEVCTVQTPLGRLSVLICGDLFDDDVVAKVRALRPDLLLFPFCRNFGDGSFDQARWDREERNAYSQRAAVVGCTTLMVNGIEDPKFFEYAAFGGAWVVSAQGEVLAERPLGRPGILLADL